MAGPTHAAPPARRYTGVTASDPDIAIIRRSAGGALTLFERRLGALTLVVAVCCVAGLAALAQAAPVLGAWGAAGVAVATLAGVMLVLIAAFRVLGARMAQRAWRRIDCAGLAGGVPAGAVTREEAVALAFEAALGGARARWITGIDLDAWRRAMRAMAAAPARIVVLGDGSAASALRDCASAPFIEPEPAPNALRVRSSLVLLLGLALLLLVARPLATVWIVNPGPWALAVTLVLTLPSGVCVALLAALPRVIRASSGRGRWAAPGRIAREGRFGCAGGEISTEDGLLVVIPSSLGATVHALGHGAWAGTFLYSPASCAEFRRLTALWRWPGPPAPPILPTVGGRDATRGRASLRQG